MHRRAKLTVLGRRLLVDRIVAQGWPVAVGDRGTSPCHLIGLARFDRTLGEHNLWERRGREGCREVDGHWG